MKKRTAAGNKKGIYDKWTVRDCWAFPAAGIFFDGGRTTTFSPSSSDDSPPAPPSPTIRRPTQRLIALPINLKIYKKCTRPERGSGTEKGTIISGLLKFNEALWAKKQRTTLLGLLWDIEFIITRCVYQNSDRCIDHFKRNGV
uniref:Uncharacterized protein n=1 Tax=Romanomermis culicivorax TaxID=13658 RepID=A0A915HFH6_ROMCU